MDDAVSSFLVGGIAVLLAFLLTPLILRRLVRIPPVLVFAGVGVAAEIAALAIGASIVPGFRVWPASSVVALGSMATLFAFSAVYKSVSLRLCAFLVDQPDERATVGTLVERIGRPTVDSRMALLQQMGLVVQRVDGVFEVTPAGRRSIGRLRAVRRLFGVGGVLYTQRPT